MQMFETMKSLHHDEVLVGLNSEIFLVNVFMYALQIKLLLSFNLVILKL